MSIRIKATETKQKVGVLKDEYVFQLKPQKNNTLELKKVLADASKICTLNPTVITSALEGFAEAMMTWLTEGHSIIVPGFGTMRYSINAKVANTIDEVSPALITKRKIIFTPFPDLKQQLNDTDVIITCYDRKGKELKTIKEEKEEATPEV